MNTADMCPLARRLPRQTVLKSHNIRLDRTAECLLTEIKDRLRGKKEHDIPSSSVIFRHALTRYGGYCLSLTEAALTQERKEVARGTYLPHKRQHHETA